VLRFRSPVQSMFRTVARDTLLGGQTLHRGDSVLAWIGAANRDDDVFDEPDRFDIRRVPNKHLAFGQASNSVWVRRWPAWKHASPSRK
jgi:cytochrome P450